MKKTTLLFFAALFSFVNAFSQAKKAPAKPVAKELYTFYAIKNGVKTKINSDSKFVMEVGPDGMNKSNIALEFDVQAFHKKHPYDFIWISVFNYTKNTSYTYSKEMNFIDAGEAKVMSQTTTKKYTLYPQTGAEYKDHEPLFKTSNTISTDWQGDSMAFLIRGVYSNGTETYYDDYSNSIKTKHNTTKPQEITPSITLLFKYDKAYLNSVHNHELRATIQNGNPKTNFKKKEFLSAEGVENQLIKNAQYSENYADMMASKTFIKDYFEARYKDVRAIENDVEYIEKMDALVKELTFLDMSKMTTEQKKTLDKLIKKNKAATTEEIVNFFKAANPAPPSPLAEYVGMIAK